MKISALIPVILYGIVGLISLSMAFKCLSAKRFIKFHEKAAATNWDDLDKPFQSVILAIIKVSGLGFLIVASLLLIFPIVNHLRQDVFLRFSIPVISLVFCSGLFLINYNLHRQTKSKTPWIGSLIAMGIIIAGMVLSLFIE